MTQEICLTPRILQEILKAVLEDEIGTYTYCDSNFTTEAISIGNPPNDVSVDGLEVIIPIYPDVYSEQNGRFTGAEQYWDICLIERLGGSGKIFQAVPKLLDLFYCAKGYYSRQQDAVGEYEMYRVEFKIVNSTDRFGQMSGLQRLIDAAALLV